MFDKQKKIADNGPVRMKSTAERKPALRKLTFVYALRVDKYLCDVHAEIYLGTHDDTRKMDGRFLLMASKLEEHRDELSEKTIDDITQLDLTDCDYIIFKAKVV